MLKKYYIYKNEPNSYMITIFGENKRAALKKFNELTNKNLKFVNKFDIHDYILVTEYDYRHYNFSKFSNLN